MSAWFDLVKKHDPWFQRKDDRHLVMSFLGYKCENYFTAQRELLEVGGGIMSADFDEQSGRTYCVVVEPRAEVRRREVERQYIAEGLGEEEDGK